MSDVEFTGNESFEELEAKLAEIEGADDVVIEDDPASPPDTPAKPATQTGDNADPSTSTAEPDPSAAGNATATPPPGGEARPQVFAKDGVHTIPYEVLEATRERARQAEERVQQLSADAAKVQQLEQQLQTLKQRAVDAGADESLLTEDGLTDEQLAELAEEYPALGRHLRALTQKINAISTPPAATPATQPGTNPVDVALTHTPDLDGWRFNDPDRWDMAVVIDEQLQKDPAFSGKSMVQRFQEVERRVKSAFGDSPAARQEQASIVAQAENKVAAAATQLPGSPSDVGSTVAHVPDKVAQIAALSGEALIKHMETYSDTQIDSLLDSLPND